MNVLCKTTQIPPSKTIAEIQKVLTAAGALAVLIENDPALRRPRALKFQLQVGQGTMAFVLPARVDGVVRALQQARSPRTRWQGLSKDKAAAERIAWRQILRWVEAQVALAQLQLADLAEVFLPFALTPAGRTLYQEVQEHHLGGLLPAEAQRP